MSVDRRNTCHHAQQEHETLFYVCVVYSLSVCACGVCLLGVAPQCVCVCVCLSLV